jgi:hypothetical protein
MEHQLLMLVEVEECKLHQEDLVVAVLDLLQMVHHPPHQEPPTPVVVEVEAEILV